MKNIKGINVPKEKELNKIIDPIMPNP